MEPRRETSRNYYSDALKLRIINEVESGILTKDAARRQYGIKGKSAILNWQRKFFPERYGLFNGVELQDMIESRKAGDTDLPGEEASIPELKGRIRELERQLHLSNVKAEAFELMVELAEEELKKDIRKKFATKPSEKRGKDTRK